MTKYKSKRTQVDNIWFDSKREAHKYSELKLLEKVGLIANLQLQPVFKLSIEGRPILIRSKGYPNGRQAKYTADFAYTDVRIGKRVFLDAKGFATEAYKIRRAIVEAMFPGVLIEEC